jgi:Flp pilus assembly pilin Flp
MKKMKKLNQNGQGLTEYLILMLLICVVSVAAAQGLGKTVRNKLKEARDNINKISPYDDRD